MSSGVNSFLRSLVRRKAIETDSVSHTQLNRCLSTFDLTFLGIGSTLGLGIYVLAGQVASTKAGPAVTISFLVAAVASVFSGLCYAEFGSRVPKAGSAYVYSYVTVGEFMAFVIGWNLILEYVIGTASVARGYSGYVDALFNNTIEHHLRQWMPFNVGGMSPYPDFFALGITLFLTIMLAVGVKESTQFNNIFTGLNLLVVLYAVISGLFKANIHNWQLSPSEIPPAPENQNYGNGGFFPFGIGGMLDGAATCFYGFVGFDCIATTGEEVRNPQKAIPISIIGSLFVVFLAYFGVSAIETLVWPYYDQNQNAPLPYIFEQVGWPVAKWVISIGALAGLSTSLLGGMFPLPRVIYAMASDGLVFRFLAKVHPRLKTPLIATAISGLFAGSMAMLFDVNELANMMSIGTLLAYTLVAVSVLLLRYRMTHNVVQQVSPTASMSVSVSKRSEMTNVARSMAGNSCLGSVDAFVADYEPVGGNPLTCQRIFRALFNMDKVSSPNELTSSTATLLVCTMTVLLAAVNSILVYVDKELFSGDFFVVIPFGIMVLLAIINIIALARQPSSSTEGLSFVVPLMPIIPILSMFVNTYLMLRLPLPTWKRFAIWMAAGLLVYFLYGIWNSSQRRPTISRIDSDTGSSTDMESGKESQSERSPLVSS